MIQNTREDVFTRACKFVAGSPHDTDVWPQAQKAEQSVLCCLLNAPKESMAFLVNYGVGKDHFFLPAHKIVYTAISEIIEESKPVDFITIGQKLKDGNQLEGVGGPAYLNELYVLLPSWQNVGFYLRILQDKHARRVVMEKFVAGYAVAKESNERPSEFLDAMQKIASSICSLSSKASDQTIREQALKIAQKRAQDSGERIQGLSTPFPALDAYTGGLGAGHLVVISGMKKKKKGKDYGKSSGSGKTTLATDLFRHVMYHHKKPAIFLSMEMSYEEIFNRMISAWSSIPLQTMTRKKLSDDNEGIVQKWIEWIGSTKSKICDGGRLTLAEVVAKIRSFHALNPTCPLAIIDYFQLIESPYRKDWTMAQVSKEKSNALKGLANELGITIVVLSQLNSTGDVAEGKTLEDDADALYVIDHNEDGSFIQLQKNRHGADRDEDGETPCIPVTHNQECVCFEAK